MSTKVLLLDDDTSSVAEFEAALRALGYDSVLVAENDVLGAGRALARLGVDPVSLIIVSVAPPSLAGLATFSRMRRDPRARGVPMMLVSTAFGMLDDHARSTLPADAYLQRPHDPAVFLPELRRCLTVLGQSSQSQPITRKTAEPEPEALDAEDLEPVDEAGPPDDADSPEVASADPSGVDNIFDGEEAPLSGLLPVRESRLMSEVPQSRGNPDELRERLREGRQVLAQLQERLHNEREEHRMALGRVEASLSSAAADKDAALKRAILGDSTARGLEGQIERLRAHAERLEGQLEQTIEQLAATGRQQREVEESRAREGHESTAKAEAARALATETAVADVARRLRDEHAETLATRDREHAAALGLLNATLEKERRERAEEASWHTDDSPSVAPIKAELESVKASQREAAAAYAATLSAIDEARSQERAAASQRLDLAEKGAAEAVLVGIRQGRQMAADELAETLDAMRRAHESDVSRELLRTDAAKAAALAEQEGAREDLQRRLDTAAGEARGFQEQLRVAEHARTLLASERDRLAREIAASRAEQEAALWAAAVEAEHKAAEEHANEARQLAAKVEAARGESKGLAAKLEAETARATELAAALRDAKEAQTRLTRERDALQLEAADSALDARRSVDRSALDEANGALATLRASHAAEMVQLDRSVDRLLEQERSAAVRSIAETRAAAVQAVAIGVKEAQRIARQEFDAQLAERDRVRGEAVRAEQARGDDARRELAVLQEQGVAVAKTLEEQRRSERDRHGAALAALDQALKVERERAAAAAALAETAFEATKRKITEEREREAARVRSLEEQLRSDREAVAAEVAARAVVEEQLAARMRVGEEAQRVEQQKISAALASATSDLETLRRELVGVRERETARASSLDAQLQSERAAHAAAVAALAVGRKEQERAATELAAASAAYELRNQALLDERDQATRSLTLEHEAHERSLIEEHEANKRSLIEEHDANKRSLTLEHERERAPLQTRVEQLEAECVARAAEQQRLVAEVDAQRTRLVSDAEAERSDRALALARANEELKSQSERAREAFEAEQKRATGALAAAMADFAAQQFALVEERERASARATSLEEQLMSARADHAAVVAAASQDDGEPLRRAEAALAEEQARSEALAIALRTAREGEQDLAEEQRRLRREYDAERRASEATLARASRDAQVAVRESAAGFAAEKARAEALSKELEQERASRDERIDQSARDGAAERERHEATLEQAIREARETVQRVQAHGEEQTAQAAGNAARLERVIAERDASLAADRDESNRRWLLLQTEHARTIERLLAADVESRAQQSAEHELALDELRCELNDQHRVAAEARAQELARFGSAHDAVVARLEAELTVAREALAAERRSRSAPAGRPRTQPERIRSDAEYRIVSEEPRVSAVPSTRPAVVRPSGEVAIPRDPHDPREILRNVLLRSLAEDQAELAITMALGAAGRRELPAQRDELLALIERHLLAELIDHLGREEANALMDQLSAALAAETTAESTPVAPLFRPKTTQPPPEMKSHVPTLRPSLSPASDLQRPPAVNRRSVLLIDADRAARARVARALENVGCQVVVRDSCAEVASTVQDFDVLVTDILGVALDELLTSFAQRPPPCAIIAWTDDVDTARALFGASGLHRVLILRRDARGEALVDAVCASLGDLKGVARG